MLTNDRMAHVAGERRWGLIYIHDQEMVHGDLGGVRCFITVVTVV